MLENCYQKELPEAGCDEAGRGCLAGPVFAAAVMLLFLQIVYGRSQSAFSEDGLAVGAGLEDLGKGLRSQVGTMYGTLKKAG